MQRLKIGVILLIVLSCFVGSVIKAEDTVHNPIAWLEQLETLVLGEPQSGSLYERIDRFEQIVTGKNRDGSLVERLAHLDQTIYVNQPHDISLFYKTQALEWVLFKELKPGFLKFRLEQIEKLLFGQVYSGPITKRLEKLINHIFPGGSVQGRWVSIPEGLLIKIRMIDGLSSQQNHSGDSFKYEVIETAIYNNSVIFPKGSQGIGVLQQVRRPGNLGRDAMLTLDFQALRSLDGSPIQVVYGSKASEMNSSHKRAVGASTAGMIAFGPEGILFGLVIKGSEKTIKESSEFYVQVKDASRIYTIEK